MSDVTFGVKMPEELKVQIESLMKDSGLRTGKDFMQNLVNNYVLEKTKEQLPEIAQDLKELQGLTQRIDNIYLSLGYRIENITKAQHEETVKEMSKKDSIISDLQEKINSLGADKDTITEAYNNIVNQNSEYLQRVNELTENNKNIKELNEEYKNKVDTMAGIVEEYKQYKAEISAVKEQLSNAQLTITNNKSILNIAHESLAKANRESNNAIDELNKEIEKLKTDHTAAIELVKEKAEMQKDKLILEFKQQEQEKIQRLQEETNSKINEYQAKYKALLEELEHSKTKKPTAKDKVTQV